MPDAVFIWREESEAQKATAPPAAVQPILPAALVSNVADDNEAPTKVIDADAVA